MGNFDKKYIIREAENILEECRKRNTNTSNEKNKIISLKIYNKKLKRKLTFWKCCSMSCVVLFFVALILK